MNKHILAFAALIASLAFAWVAYNGITINGDLTLRPIGNELNPIEIHNQ